MNSDKRLNIPFEVRRSKVQSVRHAVFPLDKTTICTQNTISLPIILRFTPWKLSSIPYQFFFRSTVLKKCAFIRKMRKLVSENLKDPSHPLCFARLEDDMRHFQCHQNSSFLQCEFKSFYILPNIAHSGLNSPSTRSQTISGFI